MPVAYITLVNTLTSCAAPTSCACVRSLAIGRRVYKASQQCLGCHCRPILKLFRSKLYLYFSMVDMLSTLFVWNYCHPKWSARFFWEMLCHVLNSIRGLHNVTTQRMICELKYQINVSLTEYNTSYAINKGRLCFWEEEIIYRRQKRWSEKLKRWQCY